MWLPCVSTRVCMYVCTVCICVLMHVRVCCVCSREISYCFKYTIKHKSLYTIAVSIDLCGRIE